MNTKIKGTNLTVTPAIRRYFQEKMDMLEKYLGDVPVLHCYLEIEKVGGVQSKGEIFRAEANILVPRRLLRVEKTQGDLYAAIDKVKDSLELLIKKHKEKRTDKLKKQRLKAARS